MKKTNRILLLLFAPLLLILGLAISGRIALESINKSMEQEWKQRKFSSVESFLVSGLSNSNEHSLSPSEFREAELGLQGFLRLYKNGRLDDIRLNQSPSDLDKKLIINPLGLVLFSTITDSTNSLDGGNLGGLPDLWDQIWNNWPEDRYKLIEQECLIQILGFDPTSLKYSKVDDHTQISLTDYLVSLKVPNIIKYQSSFALKPDPKNRDPKEIGVYDVSMFVRTIHSVYPVTVRIVLFRDAGKYLITDIAQGYVGAKPPPRRFIL